MEGIAFNVGGDIISYRYRISASGSKCSIFINIVEREEKRRMSAAVRREESIITCKHRLEKRLGLNMYIGNQTKFITKSMACQGLVSVAKYSSELSLIHAAISWVVKASLFLSSHLHVGRWRALGPG